MGRVWAVFLLMSSSLQLLGSQSARADDSALPARWDWRNVDGHSYLPPVEAQGSCEACVSFAAVAALEATLKIACRSPEHSFALSSQFHFSCSGATCQAGMTVTQGMQALVSQGVPDAACMPYASFDGHDVSCTAACSDSGKRTIKGMTFTQPTTGFIDIEAIKRGLIMGPLVANLILFEDLRSYTTGVYHHQTGDQVGTHAVVLVGWNDADQAWIVRNSWGPSWGDGGYFEIAWSDPSLPGRYTWLLDIDTPRERGLCGS